MCLGCRPGLGSETACEMLLLQMIAATRFYHVRTAGRACQVHKACICSSLSSCWLPMAAEQASARLHAFRSRRACAVFISNHQQATGLLGEQVCGQCVQLATVQLDVDGHVQCLSATWFLVVQAIGFSSL